MDEDSLNQFLSINQILRKKVYSIQMPEAIILYLDSTLLNAYGKEEGISFIKFYCKRGLMENFINESKQVLTLILSAVI